MEPKRPTPGVYNKKGEILQCNQGRYRYHLYEKHMKNGDQLIMLDLYVPKYMDTSLVDVDLNPEYIRIDVKGKITQIRFGVEIMVDTSRILRS